MWIYLFTGFVLGLLVSFVIPSMYWVKVKSDVMKKMLHILRREEK